MATTFIYSLSDPFTDEVRYVGATKDIKTRYKRHFYDKDGVIVKKYEWINSIKNNGGTPLIEILEESTDSDWEFWEKFYITLYRSWGFNLLNISRGGLGGSYWLGKKRSEETKIKLSNKIKGRTLTKEHCMAISNGNAGRINSLETRIKISKSHIGVKLSEYHKKRLSDCHPRKMAIIQYDKNNNFIKEWKSAHSANKELNICDGHIGLVCKCIRKTAGGFIWKYLNNTK